VLRKHVLYCMDGVLGVLLGEPAGVQQGQMQDSCCIGFSFNLNAADRHVLHCVDGVLSVLLG
jgi:hypothetical protein